MNLTAMSDLMSFMKQCWPALYLHSASVANFTYKVCNLLSIDEIERSKMIEGAFLHDVGKMLVRREIIEKPLPLSDKERDELKEHTKHGVALVAQRGGDKSLLEIIRYHHEHWDGKGYEGLIGTMIPLSTRIVALADALDAMISPRPYRKSHEIYEALKEVYQCAGSQFDPYLLKVLEENYFWQIATYCDPVVLEIHIEEEKQWLAQLTNSYLDLTYPLIYAQSYWIDNLLVLFFRLKKSKKEVR